MAVRAVAPMAQMSEREFAAAMRPFILGSFTIG